MAKTLEGGHGVMLSKSSTVDELAAEWLTSLRIEGRHRESTIEAYDRDIRSLISPALGQVRLGEVTSRLIEGFIRSTMQRSLSGARRARIALHQMFTLADRMEVVRPNPVTPTTTPPKRETEIVALTLEDVHIIRAALAEWAARTGHGRRQNTLLPDAIEVMLGTALRISEVLAIRAHHLDTTGPVTKLRLKSSVVHQGQRQQDAGDPEA